MAEKVTRSELAAHIVNNMDYAELHESAIVGLTLHYHANPEKFHEDLNNEGFEE